MKKDCRKWTSTERTCFFDVCLNLIIIGIWIADFFLSIFKPATPNISAAIAIAMVILLFTERTTNKFNEFLKVRREAIKEYTEKLKFSDNINE